MPHPDQIKWDQRYRDAENTTHAAQVLRDNLHLLPKQGTALDLACGLGGNALLLAQQGLTTQAWDISPVAIEKLQHHARTAQLTLHAEVHDVAAHPPEADQFDVIVVSYFLERTLTPQLVKALKKDGLLFYQTFNQPRLTGRGPQNLDYRLKENELLSLFKDLKIRYYREDALAGDEMQGYRDESLLIAQSC